uniref:Uncharacterized protein n=1 Tax=Klebsiella pneumoniae TaxID=573 RepID=A0A6G7SMB0_KLEPN|nr:hypothetical protein [Klebsiella pneumoniae]
MSLSVLQVPQQAGGPLVSSISVFAKPDEWALLQIVGGDKLIIPFC